MSARGLAYRETLIAQMQSSADQDLDIVLKPLSHPALGDIRIEDSLFAIGRTEQPFVSYEREIVAELSRRHARIFCENGIVCVADLGSKNGTTVNRIKVCQKPQALRDGDEICFGGALSYQVKLGARAKTPGHAPTLVSLTLTPERGDLALQPIVIARFPFLISKTDDTFSRYKTENAQQLSYISRRHAHIFLKGGLPFIEDLGSTNGTFVSGKRLDEHAVPRRGPAHGGRPLPEWDLPERDRARRSRVDPSPRSRRGVPCRSVRTEHAGRRRAVRALAPRDRRAQQSRASSQTEASAPVRCACGKR
jgi:pSer/pThr/pTyr-binding forkhead associated (FHA) protein